MKPMLAFVLIVPVVFAMRARAQCPDGFVTSDKNLIVNGDFSQGNSGFESDYLLGESYEGKSDYLYEGYYAIDVNPGNAHPHYARCSGRNGTPSKMMILNGSYIPNQKVWKQKVQVLPNTNYFFSTWIVNLVPAAPSNLVFSINGSSLGEPIIAPMETCQWKQFYAVWNSGSNTEAEIGIVNMNLAEGGNDFALDDIVFYACESLNITTPMQSATVGTTIALRNVFFDVGKSELKPESFAELELLRSTLASNPKMTIAISGHTDDDGTAEDNLKLSHARAKAVNDYLIGKGIPKARLAFRGFGEEQPIASNQTLEGKQKNRRVEFEILKR